MQLNLNNIGGQRNIKGKLTELLNISLDNREDAEIDRLTGGLASSRHTSFILESSTPADYDSA